MRVTKPGVVGAPEDTTIDFEGETIAARSGESVAAALVASGHYAFRRTATTGDRGLFCGMGACSECAVQLGGEAGRLACMEKVVAGLSAERNPAARQLWAADAPGAGASAPPEEVFECELLVVGAGPGGLRAAVAAARAGVSVTVVDERSEAGGQYLKQPVASLALDEPALDAQYRLGRALLREVKERGVELVLGVRVWGTAGRTELYAVSRSRRLVLRSRALVLATGAFERAAPFPGWTLPGVITTGAAQTLLRSCLVAAGARVLIAGNGPLNLQVAAEMAAAGVKVVAVAETAPIFRLSNALHLARMSSAAPGDAGRGFGYLLTLARSRVPLLARTTVVAVTGEGRAEVATVCRIDGNGQPQAGTAREFEVDVVCLGLGFVPSSELARSLGCEHRVDGPSGVLRVVRDRDGRTSVDGVWVVGDGGGVGGAQVAQAMGTLAGTDAAGFLGGSVGHEMMELRRRAQRELARSERFQRSLWRLYAAPRLVDQLASAETVVCRCEEVTLAQLTNAVSPWLAAAGALKRVTRAGMGKCQGRYCSPVLIELAARQSGEPIGPFSGLLPQAPFTPVEMSCLASAGPPGTSTVSECRPPH